MRIDVAKYLREEGEGGENREILMDFTIKKIKKIKTHILIIYL